MIQVRKATNDDIVGIQQVAHVTWHDTYEHTMRPDTRAHFLVEFYSEESLAHSLQRQDAVFLVAEKEGQIIGFVQALPRPHLGYEITRAYVLPKYQHQGVGSQLHTELVSQLPDQSLWAIVQRDNYVAIAFYRKHGFEQQRELELPIYGETPNFIEFAKA